MNVNTFMDFISFFVYIIIFILLPFLAAISIIRDNNKLTLPRTSTCIGNKKSYFKGFTMYYPIFNFKINGTEYLSISVYAADKPFEENKEYNIFIDINNPARCTFTKEKYPIRAYLLMAMSLIFLIVLFLNQF